MKVDGNKLWMFHSGEFGRFSYRLDGHELWLPLDYLQEDNSNEIH